jgi:ABC-type dipeptide/oligopeptide/nickel transport system ATPase component
MLKSIDNAKLKKQSMESMIINCSQEQISLRKELEKINRTRTKYKAIIDKKYTKAINELEGLLNDVVSTIFHDEDYSIKIDITDVRNKSISWYLIDNYRERVVSLKRGTGKGVRTVVSTVLFIYYLLVSGKKYLLVDELFCNISEAYLPRMFNFIKDICKSKNFGVLLITHNATMKYAADTLYSMNNGNLQNVTRLTTATSNSMEIDLSHT